MSERAIQTTIVEGLRLGLPHGWEVVHVANNPRSKVAGAMEKKAGARKGFPDLVILGQHADGRPATFFLECKKPGSYLRKEQRDMHDRLKDLGFPVAVVKSWDEAISACRGFGLPLRIAEAA